MKTNVIVKVTINADKSLVFKYLTDLKLHFLWNPHLQKISPQTKLKEGMEYQSRSLMLGVAVKSNNVVSKLIDDKELEITNNTGLHL